MLGPVSGQCDDENTRLSGSCSQAKTLLLRVATWSYRIRFDVSSIWRLDATVVVRAVSYMMPVE